MQLKIPDLPLRLLIIVSSILLVALNVLSFYGIYTNKFYFLKFDNYIFPILSLVHLAYLYLLWTKNKEQNTSTFTLRNIEFALYLICTIYIFKFIESIYILSTYTDFDIDLIPKTFYPIGLIQVFLHFFLLVITILAFMYRKKIFGAFDFNDINEGIDL